MRRALLCSLLVVLAGCGTPDVAAPTAPPSAPVRTVALPTSVDVPSIGAHSTLVPLGLNPDRTVATPPLAQPMQGGWYSLGVRPGDIGPAVLLGHVDAFGRPGLFYRLHEVTPGALVHVGRADGSTVTFRITHVDTTPKSRFDPVAVYGDTPDAEIRLVTCGGKLDATAHSYLDNVVAFGVLAS